MRQFQMLRSFRQDEAVKRIRNDKIGLHLCKRLFNFFLCGRIGIPRRKQILRMRQRTDQLRVIPEICKFRRNRPEPPRMVQGDAG